MNPHWPTKSAKEHFGILPPVYNSQEKRLPFCLTLPLLTQRQFRFAKKHCERAISNPPSAPETQAITCSDGGELSKANSLLAINT